MLEKAREAGAHTLSGAVLDPSTLRELIPDFEAKGAPLAVPVHRDHVYFLTSRSKLPFPIIPPPLQNHGNFIISLNALRAVAVGAGRERRRSTSSPGLPDRKC